MTVTNVAVTCPWGSDTIRTGIITYRTNHPGYGSCGQPDRITGPVGYKVRQIAGGTYEGIFTVTLNGDEVETTPVRPAGQTIAAINTEFDSWNTRWTPRELADSEWEGNVVAAFTGKVPGFAPRAAIL